MFTVTVGVLVATFPSVNISISAPSCLQVCRVALTFGAVKNTLLDFQIARACLLVVPFFRARLT